MSRREHARIKFASSFKGQSKYLPKLVTYKSTLPTSNWMTPVETAYGMTLTEAVAILSTCIGYDNLKDSNKALSMNDFEARDKLSGPLMEHMDGGLQVIKTINEPDFGPVRLWGGDISVTGKMNTPTKFPDQMAQFLLYSNKYGTFATGTAPIEFYQVKHNYIMADDVTAMNSANAKDASAESLKSISENNTELRNNAWENALGLIIKLYNVAKATYRDFYRELGLMGFDMSENAPSHVDQISTANQLSQVGIHGAIIGSVIENLEDFKVIIHPGVTMSRPPIYLEGKSIIAVKQFMSQFIMENPDPVRKARIRSTVRRSR